MTSAPETPPGFIPRACDFGQAPVFGNATASHAEHAQAPASPQASYGQPEVAQTFGIGTKGTTTTFHNIGSPLSGQATAGWGGANCYDQAYPPPQAAAPNFGRWAPGAGTEHQPFDPKLWTTEYKKVTKELRAYDGDMAHYDNWRRRVRDHFVSVNHNYSTVFNLIENTKSPIRWNSLATTVARELPYLDWQWVATHIWTFTAGFLVDTQLSRRTTLVMGEEFNGIELWRSLFRESCGGSVQLSNMERSHFIAFPRCDKAADLSIHLGQWIELKGKYGLHLPEEHLIGMFWEILPIEIRDEVKKQRDLQGSLQKQIDHVYVSLDTHLDDRLSRWNLSKLQSQLKGRQKNTTGINSVEVESSVPAPPVPDMATMQANIERIVAAAMSSNNGQRGRTNARSPAGSRSGSAGSNRAGRKIPSPTFKGCWCCGDEKHSRRDCPKFKKIIADNGGKVPKDYQGAYEKSIASKRATPIKAVSASPNDGAEFAETNHLLYPTLRMPPPRAPIATNNHFEAFSDGDDDDDESEVMKALSALTPNITKASAKTSQSKRSKSNRPLDFAHVNAIAREVKQGKISLPDVDLDSDATYTCQWALVDSGAGANVARKKHFKKSRRVEAPDITLSAANGEVIPNDGAHSVETIHRDGTKISRIFYMANVDMPILAVTELTKEGSLGSEVRFRKRDGLMVDNATGRKQHFVKRKGVYFIKLYVPNDGEHPALFSRPDM